MKLKKGFLLLGACLLMGIMVSKAQSGIPVEDEAIFKVFPNPNPGEDTYVSLKGFEAQDLLVVVYDMFGREIYSKIEVKENEGFLFTIATDGKRLASGVYLITASANDRVFRQKLIVK
jgi:hypothetical protein